MLDTSRHFTGCQSDKIIFKIATYVFRFFEYLPPYLSLCLSVYTPSCTLHSSSGEKLFLVKDENLRALVTGRSLFRLPLSGTTFLLTSDTAVLSHTSKLLLKPFSLLLHYLVHTLSYTIPFKDIGCYP